MIDPDLIEALDSVVVIAILAIVFAFCVGHLFK